MKVLFYTFLYALGLVGFFPILGQTTYYVVQDGTLNDTSVIVASTALTSCPSSETACNRTPVTALPGSFSDSDSIQVCCDAMVDVSATGTFQGFANITIESGASLTTTNPLRVTGSLTVAGDLTVNPIGIGNNRAQVNNGLTVQTGGTVTLNGGTLRVDNVLDNSGTIDFLINGTTQPEMNFVSNLNTVTFNLGNITNPANARVRISGTGMYTLGFPGVSSGRMDFFQIRCENCTVNQNAPLQTKTFQMTMRASNATYSVGSSMDTPHSLDISEDIILVDGQFDLNDGTLTLGSSMTSVNFDPSGGTFNAGSGQVTINGNFAPTGGTFNFDTSTMRIDASGGDRMMPTGNRTFHNLEVINSGSTNRTFTCIPGQTVTINESFKLMGASMSRLTFTNGGGSTKCIFNLAKQQNMNDFSFSTIQGIDSSDSPDAVEPIIFTENAMSLNITDGGDTEGWFGMNPYTAPAGLMAAITDSIDVELTWTTATGFTYDLYWSTTAGVTTGTGTKISNVTTPHTHENLAANTTYYYIITAKTNPSRVSPPSAEVSAITEPPLPSDLQANADDTQITLSWTATTGFTYDLYWSTTAGVTTGTGTKISNVTTPHTHENLDHNTTYYYIIITSTSDGSRTSSPSSEVSDTTPPSVPSGLQAVADGTQITLSWTTETGITYELYWLNTSGVTTSTGTQISGVTSPHVHTGLSLNTTYYYILTASDGSQTSLAGSEVSATTPPPAPSGLQTVAADTRITLSWTTETGITYDLYWSNTPGVTTVTGTQISGVSSPHIHAGLTPETTHYYILTASTGNPLRTSSPSGEKLARTTPLPPPSGLRAVADGNQITLSWTTRTGITYDLYWSNTPGVTTVTGTQISGVNSPHIHTGLTLDTTYYYILTASIGSLTSFPSGEVSATTPPPPPPLSPPSGLRVSILDDTQIELSWTPEEGAIYDLYWSNTPGATTGTGEQISNVTPPFTHTGLSPQTTYYYILTASAIDGSRTSSASNEISAKTRPPPPSYSLSDIKVGPTIYRPSVGDFGINFMRLPKNTQIEVKNVKGSRIYRFTTTRHGDHRWNVRTDRGSLLGSGVYIVYFSHEDTVRQVKFMVVR